MNVQEGFKNTCNFNSFSLQWGALFLCFVSLVSFFSPFGCSISSLLLLLYWRQTCLILLELVKTLAIQPTSLCIPFFPVYSQISSYYSLPLFSCLPSGFLQVGLFFLFECSLSSVWALTSCQSIPQCMYPLHSPHALSLYNSLCLLDNNFVLFTWVLIPHTGLLTECLSFLAFYGWITRLRLIGYEYCDDSSLAMFVSNCFQILHRSPLMFRIWVSMLAHHYLLVHFTLLRFYYSICDWFLHRMLFLPDWVSTFY